MLPWRRSADCGPGDRHDLLVHLKLCNAGGPIEKFEAANFRPQWRPKNAKPELLLCVERDGLELHL